MEIAIKVVNGETIIDTTFLSVFGEQKLDLYGYSKVYVPFDDVMPDDFDGINFNKSKYETRKEKERAIRYENEVMYKIRQRYSINQELALLRQGDSKPIEYQEYYDYVELCKASVKSELGITEV